MIERRPFNQLASADHGWLKAKHHFSFADYQDPKRIGHGALRFLPHMVAQAIDPAHTVLFGE